MNQISNIPATKKVLIIDDEKVMAKAMEVKLRKEGIDAVAVFSGDEGLAEIEKGEYALVLLDIMMPIIDGWSILAEVQKKNLPIKIIITSNLSQEEDRKKALSMGALDFLVKSDSSLAAIATMVQTHL
jgi:two-component system response regulator VicR